MTNNNSLFLRFFYSACIQFGKLTAKHTTKLGNFPSRYAFWRTVYVQCLPPNSYTPNSYVLRFFKEIFKNCQLKTILNSKILQILKFLSYSAWRVHVTISHYDFFRDFVQRLYVTIFFFAILGYRIDTIF